MKNNLFFVLALILCNFEKNLCSWKSTSDDNLYKWQRKTMEQLSNNGYPAPEVGVNLDSEWFLYAGFKIAGVNSSSGVTASIKSPDFIIEEHPLECFSFWFYFGVS